jgi:mannitol-1-phosphate/altronate dehydrogenase
MTKLEGVFVVDSLLPFENLNIFSLNANHEIKEPSHSYLKGICAMRNML